MRIKHWIFSLAVTFLLSTGLWAQSYAVPRSNGATLVNASYHGDRYRENRYREERRERRHERHHERRHERREYRRHHGW